MDLSKKKKLAKRTLGVGEDRIVFLESRIDEIKDAITKQDIRDLQKSGAIIVKEIKGRRSSKKIKRGRSAGNVRKKIKDRKRNYVIMTRKLRAHLKSLGSSKEISKEEMKKIKKRIKNKDFKSKVHINEYMEGRQR